MTTTKTEQIAGMTLEDVLARIERARIDRTLDAELEAARVTFKDATEDVRLARDAAMDDARRDYREAMQETRGESEVEAAVRALAKAEVSLRLLTEAIVARRIYAEELGAARRAFDAATTEALRVYEATMWRLMDAFDRSRPC